MRSPDATRAVLARISEVRAFALPCAEAEAILARGGVRLRRLS